MEGFKTIWADGATTGCVVLFNASWVLRTRGEFLLAFAMIMIMAAGSEALGWYVSLRGYSRTTRGDAAAATRMFRGFESRRRRGRHADIPWIRVAARATRK